MQTNTFRLVTVEESDGRQGQKEKNNGPSARCREEEDRRPHRQGIDIEDCREEEFARAHAGQAGENREAREWHTDEILAVENHGEAEQAARCSCRIDTPTHDSGAHRCQDDADAPGSAAEGDSVAESGNAGTSEAFEPRSAEETGR
jgi:hypothetical protein